MRNHTYPAAPISTRNGMTLLEMLIAMTLTLILMGAVAQAFSAFGRGVNKSRNSIELRQQAHAVAIRLREDFGGLTVIPKPPASPSSNVGYFEYIEGPLKDLPAGESSLKGDIDDILLFTTVSQGAPFLGTLLDPTDPTRPRTTIQSPAAEILYYCAPTAASPNPDLQTYNLHRRQRLVMVHPFATPFVNPATGMSPDGGAPNTFPAFGDTFAEQYNNATDVTDISFRIRNGRVVPNSLGDLTRRENRFFHDPVVFPHRFLWESAEFNVNAPNQRDNGYGVNGTRYGDDVILTNVISFDVRVYDPLCPVRLASTTTGNNLVTVVPGDPGYATATPSDIVGAYVDLGWGTANYTTFPMSAKYPPAGHTHFDTVGMQYDRLTPAFPPPGRPANYDVERPTYDTWSTHYEHDGIDDWGTNDTDDDADGLIDEFDEKDTSPPYPVPLQGLEIRIRCYEPSTQSIRQMTVRHSF